MTYYCVLFCSEICKWHAHLAGTLVLAVGWKSIQGWGWGQVSSPSRPCHGCWASPWHALGHKNRHPWRPRQNVIFFYDFAI